MSDPVDTPLEFVLVRPVLPAKIDNSSPSLHKVSVDSLLKKGYTWYCKTCFTVEKSHSKLLLLHVFGEHTCEKSFVSLLPMIDSSPAAASGASASAHQLLPSFVTINPRDVDPMSFHERVMKMLKWSTITKAWYCFEQRGTTPEDTGKGPHCHILLIHKCKRKKLTDLLCRFWVNDKWCGTRKHVNLQKPYSMSDDDFIEDHIQYIQGNKFDSDKDPKIVTDYVWRENNLIEKFYFMDKNAVSSEISEQEEKEL